MLKNEGINMNTDAIRSEKNIYLIHLSEQLEKFKNRSDSIKEKIESKNFPNDNEVKEKFKKLEKCMNRFSWKIHHLEESENMVDDLVQNSFNDLTDEISWRIDGVELAIEGKQLWDAGKELLRDRNRIKKLKESSKKHKDKIYY
jgi:hypothetical protein